jgi:hypothetical protein
LNNNFLYLNSNESNFTPSSSNQFDFSSNP